MDVDDGVIFVVVVGGLIDFYGVEGDCLWGGDEFVIEFCYFIGR